MIFVLGFVEDFDGNGGPNLLLSSGRQDLSDLCDRSLVLRVFLFLRFSSVFSCDFRFVSFSQPFREIFHGSVSPLCLASVAQFSSRIVVI